MQLYMKFITNNLSFILKEISCIVTPLILVTFIQPLYIYVVYIRLHVCTCMQYGMNPFIPINYNLISKTQRIKFCCISI